MIPQISYNVLIDRFRAFAEAHFLIKGFSHGDLSNIDIEKEVEFPWMHVLPVEVEPRAGTRLYSFVIIFADLPRDKETPAEYQRECISDCIKLAEDLLAEVQNGQIVFGPFVELDGGASIEVFINEFSHTLVGVNLQLTLSVPWDWSACDIPADFTIGGSGSGGEGVAVGITLQTNGVNNGLQSLLNLQQGTNVTIVDNGNGTVTINSTGGGGGGGGTVTSVALTVPSAFAVIGSPITGAGTLAITGSGTSGDYIDGTGALQTFPAIPTAQGLQDVITTDPVLTADNTIDANTFGLTIDGTSNFTVNSSSKIDINVNSDAALGIDANSVTLQKVTGTTQTQVLTDTTKASISASESASANETSLTLFPNSARLKTPNVNDATATVGQVLTLSNAGTGEVEFTTVGGGGSVTSVGLTMPSAFTVAGSPVTTAGTLAVTGAGLASQYVRGDGTLANFPTGGGGGASVNYYLNGSVSQGAIGGATFHQLSKTAIIGAGTDFVRTNGAGNGYIAQFITDINDPALLLIPSGNWHFETFFSASNNGGNPSFYIELYKYNGVTLTLIASNSANPEGITAGTVIDLYTSVISVPATVITASDRIAIRIFVTTSGRTLTLHTEGPHLSEITTTFSTGITAINSLTAQVQSLTTGTAGTDYTINSAGSVHTFNLPTASAANRGALSSADWLTFNGKQNSIGLTTVGNNLATLPNPSAVRYLRINADNTVAALTLAELKTDLSLGSDITLVVAANVVNVGTTFEDVTGLSFAVTANKTYKWRATISFGATSGTYLFSSNGPTTSINNARFTMTIGATTNGVSNQVSFDSGTNVTGSSNGLTTADGIVRVTASGTFTIRFRSSIAGALTIRAGSVLEYSEVL
jgi:hypothetical protein